MNRVTPGRLTCVVVAVLLPFFLRGQVVYEPTHRDVYNFLTRLANKGVLTFNDQIRPVPRSTIEALLTETEGKTDQLSALERQELAFFHREYGHERLLRTDSTLSEPSSRFFKNDLARRFRLYSYADETFKLQVNPIFGIAPNARDGSLNYHQWAGVYLHGYLGKHVGFSFDYREQYEKGPTIDRAKQFSPETGGVLLTNEGPISYGSVNAVIGTSWKWGSAALGKDFIEWGYGESGKLVLSNKAPSFPFLRLDLNPVKWLRFNYFHAVLNSRLVDSLALYPTNAINPGKPTFSAPLRSKYLVSHTFTFLPSPKVSFSLGESIVYSDRFQPVFLIPIVFFRPADYDNSGGNDRAASNSQFFFGLNLRNVLPKTQVYGTLFIDEIKLRSLFDPAKRRNQVGYQVGLSAVDVPIRHLTATVEYTRINPFVYDNYLPAQVYQSNGYNLGHWMGNNADQWYVALNYRFRRGLQSRAYLMNIRKADLGDYYWQNGNKPGPQPDFLFGKNRRNLTFFGGDVRYELVHDLFVKVDYLFQGEKYLEKKATRSFSQVTVAVNYGF